MTPKEKAEQLVSKFMANIIFSIKQNIHASTVEAAKNCSLIAIVEILKTTSTGSYNETFYKEVKQEIEKL